MTTKTEMAAGLAICLQEWQSASPETHSELHGIELADSDSRALANRLSRANILEVQEQRTGLAIQTSSFVGKIRIGNLQVIIQPKLQGMPLLSLLRYAYGLRHLSLFSELDYEIHDLTFQDLLIHQLAAEVDELISRGLLRRYTRRDGDLSSPTGRINFQKLARQGGIQSGALACTYFTRLEDCLHNQVLLAGLLYAISLTQDLPLRARLRQLAGILGESVSLARLDWLLLESIRQKMDRLAWAYQPAITLIGLLLGNRGIQFEDQQARLPLSGFLFDMNRFFQALLSRFLNDNLPGLVVEDEHSLRGMLAYLPGYNPQHRQPPQPRPDFAVSGEGRSLTLLDAKYRDLWEKSLPRDMLYQLIIYAMSQGEHGRAAILYPTLTHAPQEARIAVNDPLFGEHRAEVVLRPVNMLRLEALVSEGTQFERSKYAQYLAFG